MSLDRLLSYLCLLPLVFSGCNTSSAVSQSSGTVQAPPLTVGQNCPEGSDELPKQFDGFAREDTMCYAGYQVARLFKKVRVEDYPRPVEVSYAVLKRDGKVLAEFDSKVYHPTGNATDFGLISLLDGSFRQLVVEQTLPRNWAHWIVDLSPDHRVIFDGGEWGVDRELRYMDVDGDGVHEISQAVPAFTFFEGLTNATSHLIDVAFKYDPKAKKYLPANHVFQDYALRGIEDEISCLNRNDEQKFSLGVLHVVLRYIYAGKEAEAWSFYEREYHRPDKAELKSKIEARLRDEPVHKFIYRNGASR